MAVRGVPRKRAGRRARARLGRPGAGEGHHDPGQEHRGAARRDDHQHRGHAGALGLRRRGGARPVHGGRGAAAGGRQRGPAAADQVRAAQDAGGQAAGHPGDQQGGPPGCAHRRGRGRLLRALPGPGRHRGADRVPDRVRLSAGRPGVADQAGRRRAARLAGSRAAVHGAGRRGPGPPVRPVGAAAGSGGQPGRLLVPGPDRTVPGAQRDHLPGPAGGLVPPGRQHRAGQDHRALPDRGPGPGADRQRRAR